MKNSVIYGVKSWSGVLVSYMYKLAVPDREQNYVHLHGLHPLKFDSI